MFPVAPVPLRPSWKPSGLQISRLQLSHPTATRQEKQLSTKTDSDFSYNKFKLTNASMHQLQWRRLKIMILNWTVKLATKNEFELIIIKLRHGFSQVEGHLAVIWCHHVAPATWWLSHLEPFDVLQSAINLTRTSVQVCGSRLWASSPHLPHRCSFSLQSPFKETLRQSTNRIITPRPPTHISADFPQVWAQFWGLLRIYAVFAGKCLHVISTAGSCLQWQSFSSLFFFFKVLLLFVWSVWSDFRSFPASSENIISCVSWTVISRCAPETVCFCVALCPSCESS